MRPSGIDPATFRFVAQCLNQLRHRVPRYLFVLYIINKLSSEKPHCISENKSVAPFQIHFHSRDWTSLHKFITPDVLPPEYGGHKPEIDFRKNQQYLYDNEEKIMGKIYIKQYTILRT
jgi:hypothetical protein